MGNQVHLLGVPTTGVWVEEISCAMKTLSLLLTWMEAEALAPQGGKSRGAAQDSSWWACLAPSQKQTPRHRVEVWALPW